MSSLDPPPTLIIKKKEVKILISEKKNRRGGDSYAKQNENDGSKGMRAELSKLVKGGSFGELIITWSLGGKESLLLLTSSYQR
jgi:hypothetical protein